MCTTNPTEADQATLQNSFCFFAKKRLHVDNLKKKNTLTARKICTTWRFFVQDLHFPVFPAQPLRSHYTVILESCTHLATVPFILMWFKGDEIQVALDPVVSKCQVDAL
jgi:hypothetical protein